MKVFQGGKWELGDPANGGRVFRYQQQALPGPPTDAVVHDPRTGTHRAVAAFRSKYQVISFLDFVISFIHDFFNFLFYFIDYFSYCTVILYCIFVPTTACSVCALLFGEIGCSLKESRY